MKLTIAYHGHCFDGMASAALVTRFLCEHEALAEAEVVYRGLDHQPGGSHVPEAVLDGDVNAVVDFRYSTSPKLTWWFDHHRTGLVGEAEQEHFEADTSGRKHFDPACGSCCKLIDGVVRDRFGWSAPDLAELVRWAHVVDTAGFASAIEAVELADPALQLMAVIEAHGDDRFLSPRIPRLAAGEPLADLAREPDVERLLAPILVARDRDIVRLRELARVEGPVVRFDLSETGDERYGRFVPYYLFPEATYVVGVTRGTRRCKVSVGFNPWTAEPRRHDISALCARHGGGGHPVVGAVSVGPDEVDKARAIAADIATALSR